MQYIEYMLQRPENDRSFWPEDEEERPKVTDGI